MLAFKSRARLGYGEGNQGIALLWTFHGHVRSSQPAASQQTDRLEETTMAYILVVS
jgi:hypothetical protein